MFNFYVPSVYRVYEKESGSWVPVQCLKGRDDLFCWSGTEFCKVKINCSNVLYPVTKVAVIDCFTSIGLDSSVSNVESCTQWSPPWLFHEEKPLSGCGSTDSKSAFDALHDFGREIKQPTRCNVHAYAVPKHRFRQILSCLPPSTEHYSGGKRWEIIYIPKNGQNSMVDCESGASKFCRAHGLQYIKTVLALRGRVQRKRKDHGEHVELRDDSLQIPPKSFRKLRRIMSLCGVANRYGFRVQAAKNGKGRGKRRRVRLGIHDISNIACLDHKVKEKCKDYIETLNAFKTNYHNAIKQTNILNNIEKHTEGITWLKITLESSKSIVMEGVLLLFS